MQNRISFTRLAQEYIRSHPSVADCLERGLINHSALAREICDAHQVDAFDAVLIACRRYGAKRSARPSREKKIAHLMRRVKLHVRNKIAVVILEKHFSLQKTWGLQKIVKRERGDFNLIEGEDVITIITNSEFIDLIRENGGGAVRKVITGLVQISMAFDESLETVSGVVAHIYRLLADRGINIREEMSCWTDVMVVIDEKDLGAAMEVLSSE